MTERIGKVGGWWLAVAFLSALFLGHWVLPLRAPLAPVDPGAEWITAPASAPRAYFRRTLRVPFIPRHAWLSIGADDYELYVNGVLVGRNWHLLNASLAFQDKMSQRTQSLTQGRVFESKRAPELSKSANEEWRAVHFYDITPYLRPGENLLAVAVQGNPRAGMLVRGAVEGAFGRVEILGNASAWRVGTTAAWSGGRAWFDPDFMDSEWPAAVSGGAAPRGILGDLPAVWREDFHPPVLSGKATAGRVVLRAELPGRRCLRSSGDWLRVAASWPYALVIGDSLVGTGRGGEDVTAFDVTRYVGWRTRPLFLILFAPRMGEVPSPWAAVDGRIAGGVFTSGAEWETLAAPHPGTNLGGGRWEKARLGPRTKPRGFVRLADRNGQDIETLSRFGAFAAALAGLLAMGLAGIRRWGGRFGIDPGSTAALTIPFFLTIALEEFFRFRFQESDNTLGFYNPAMDGLWLGLPAAVLGLTAVLTRLPRGRGIALRRGLDAVRRLPWIWIILALGLLLRAYAIGFDDLQADENVSWDAARGILRTGVPQAVSGVYYTRSPLYHYLLAGWIALVGDDVAPARFFSVLPGVGVLAAAYGLVLAVTRRRGLALLTAFLLAVDPWQIHTSRIIRFYQQVQFFAVSVTWFFLKGFVWKEGLRSRLLFFLFSTLAVLSQEVFVLLLPGYALGAFLFYRPFDLRRDAGTLYGLAAFLAVALLDVAVFSLVCLTQHVGVATTSGSIIQFHLRDLLVFPMTFFVGNNRANVFYTLLAGAGSVFYWRRRRLPAGVGMLYLTIAVMMATLTVMVQQLAGRYCYLIYPFLVILAVIAVGDMVREAARRWVPAGGVVRLDRRRWTVLVGGILAAAMIVNIEPVKLAKSYHRKLNIEHETALRWIRRHRLPGDKIMSVYPMPAAILFGGIDYYLMQQISFDEVYRTERGVIDRWAGGRLVSKVDQLRRLFMRHDRMWIVIDEFEALKISEDFLDFIRRSCAVKKEFFGVRVFLWDATAGRLAAASDSGGAADDY